MAARMNTAWAGTAQPSTNLADIATAFDLHVPMVCAGESEGDAHIKANMPKKLKQALDKGLKLLADDCLSSNADAAVPDDIRSYRKQLLAIHVELYQDRVVINQRLSVNIPRRF